MKTALDRAAAESGRSQSQEAEFRLERSFEREGLLYETLEMTYGRQLAGLLMACAGAMQHVLAIHSVLALAPANWSKAPRPQSAGQLARPYVYADAIKALNAVADAFRPEGESGTPKAVSDAANKLGYLPISDSAASEILMSLAIKEKQDPASWNARVKSMLVGLGGLATSFDETTPTKKGKIA